MAEHNFFIITASDKEGRYKEFIGQYEQYAQGESLAMPLLANTAAALREAFGFFWVGFYLVRGNRLVLGPFQGSMACSTIGYGRGVCGTAWKERRTIVVPDVNLFPGHIACSSLSKSEIVVPLIAPETDGTEVTAVLDIDSDRLGSFDETDQLYLERITDIITSRL